MNTKYSLAPWTYDGAGVIISADGVIVADVHWDKSLSVIKGNANLRLAAAAPEMEHALRYIIDIMEGRKYFPDHHEEHLHQVCLSLAKEALIKAGIL